MPQIEISEDFFIQERNKAYDDYRTALWRELFQNSLDAGARKIRIHMRELEKLDGKNRTRILFEDNGHGMTRRVLNDVFFCLGKTTKAGSSESTGGFGRARLLLCFSQESYRILTGATVDGRPTETVEVRGRKGHYDYVPAVRPYRGTVFELIVDDANYGIADFQESLNSVMARCNFITPTRGGEPAPVQVLFGEGAAAPEMTWARGRFARELQDRYGNAIGDIYVNKSGPQKGVIAVRVNGLWMFDIQAKDSPQITLELSAKRSRELLLGNRDSLRWEARRVVEDFASELAADKRSALKRRHENRSGLRDVGGTLRARLPEEALLKDGKSFQEALNAGLERRLFADFLADRGFSKPLVGRRVEDIIRDQEAETYESPDHDIIAEVRAPAAPLPSTASASGEASPTSAAAAKLATSRSVTPPPPSLPTFATPDNLLRAVRGRYSDGLPKGVSLTWRRAGYPSVYIHEEGDLPGAFRSSVKDYDPDSWRNSLRWEGGDLRFEQKNVQAERLLRAWWKACEHAVGALARATGRDGMVFVPGFMFDAPDEDGSFTAACCKRITGGHALLLNPLDRNGDARFKLSERASIKRIMALAKHEAAHIPHSWHDEDYARTLTDIDSLFDEAACVADMNAARKILDYDSVVTWLKERGPVSSRESIEHESLPALPALAT